MSKGQKVFLWILGILIILVSVLLFFYMKKYSHLPSTKQDAYSDNYEYVIKVDDQTIMKLTMDYSNQLQFAIGTDTSNNFAGKEGIQIIKDALDNRDSSTQEYNDKTGIQVLDKNTMKYYFLDYTNEKDKLIIQDFEKSISDERIIDILDDFMNNNLSGVQGFNFVKDESGIYQPKEVLDNVSSVYKCNVPGDCSIITNQDNNQRISNHWFLIKDGFYYLYNAESRSKKELDFYVNDVADQSFDEKDNQLVYGVGTIPTIADSGKEIATNYSLQYYLYNTATYNLEYTSKEKSSYQYLNNKRVVFLYALKDDNDKLLNVTDTFVDLSTGKTLFEINENKFSYDYGNPVIIEKDNYYISSLYLPGGNNYQYIYNLDGKLLFEGKYYNYVSYVDNEYITCDWLQEYGQKGYTNITSYYIYDNDGELMKESRKFKSILYMLMSQNEILAVDDDNQLKLFDMNDNVLATFTSWSDESYLLNVAGSDEPTTDPVITVYATTESNYDTATVYTYHINDKLITTSTIANHGYIWDK